MARRILTDENRRRTEMLWHANLLRRLIFTLIVLAVLALNIAVGALWFSPPVGTGSRPTLVLYAATIALLCDLALTLAGFQSHRAHLAQLKEITARQWDSDRLLPWLARPGINPKAFDLTSAQLSPTSATVYFATAGLAGVASLAWASSILGTLLERLAPL